MHKSNREIIHKAYEDFARGNVPAVFAVFAVFDPGISWHIPGHGPLSGDFTGPDQIGAFFQRTMERSGGTFRIDLDRVLAVEDVVVALVTVNARRNGATAAFPEVHVGVCRTAR